MEKIATTGIPISQNEENVKAVLKTFLLTAKL